MITRGRAARRGFSLVEVVIMGAILVSAMGLALGVFGQVTEHVADATIAADLQARAQSAQLYMRSILQSAQVQDGTTPTKSQSHATVTNSFRTLTFFPVTGMTVATGLPSLGPLNTLSFQFDPGELENGVDDNGNGLIDEGTLFHLRTGSTLRRVIAERVDGSKLSYKFFNSLGPEAGASATKPDATAVEMLVSFTLQARPRKFGKPIVTLDQVIRIGIRNRQQ